MRQYPKTVRPVSDLIAAWAGKGMVVSNPTEAEKVIAKIGYYRLRGYAFHFLDKATGKFAPNVSFEQIVNLYQFNAELSSLLFYMSGKVEVALRARLCNALLMSSDPLIYLDPTEFSDKGKFWSNIGTISSEITRSKEVFIHHNYVNHDGHIPIWAAVEIMSFGTLSKVISNLRTGINTPFSKFVKSYCYVSQKGNTVVPSMDAISSWIHTVVVLRNTCAHNSRIYNKALSIKPKILASDQQTPAPQYYGLYHSILSLKYLRPSDEDWNQFINDFDKLLARYAGVVDLNRLHFPADWKTHFTV